MKRTIFQNLSMQSDGVSLFYKCIYSRCAAISTLRTRLTLLLICLSTISFAQSSPKTPSIVNVYNFVRRTSLPHGKFTHADFNTIVRQVEVNKQYGVAGTYALKYDALMDKTFQKFLLDNLSEDDDIGAWWEVTRELADKAGVEFLAEKDASLEVNKTYSLAYSVEDKKKLLDVYMADFKSVFGKFPTSIGSWVMDIESFRYAHEKYGVIAGALCRDQIGVDGFTLKGGYYDQAYYPSLKNEFIPAQNAENQLDMPIFRLLGADPIYNFESDGLRDGVGGVYSLEPCWSTGKSTKWVDWYFQNKNDENLTSFSYTQVGQENTFLWKRIEDGYEMQVAKVVEMAKKSKVKLETLKESAEWFKKKYKTTPPNSITANSDWNTHSFKTFWYSSKFYRTSGLLEGDEFYIRDLWMYNENYPSRYLTNPLTHHISTFDALPLLDAHGWSKEKRAKISFFDSNSKKPLKGSTVQFDAKDDHSYETVWTLNDSTSVLIVANEDNMLLRKRGQQVDFYIEFETIPTLKSFEGNTLQFCHNDFDYSVKLMKGTASMNDKLRIVSENGEIKLDLSMNNNSGKSNYTKGYRKNPESIDVPFTFKKSKTKGTPMCKVPAFSHNIEYKRIGETSQVELTAKDQNAQVRYTLDGSEPNETSPLYTKPIEINKTTTVKAIVTKDGFKSSRVAEGYYFRSYTIKNITSLNNHVPHKSYGRNGVRGLIDGRKGSSNWGDGNWLGYEDDLEVLVDMETPIHFNSLSITFFQSSRDWIFLPPYAELYGSNDGIHFDKLKREEYNVTRPIIEIDRQNFTYQNKENKAYRYFKLFAKSQEICPSWSIAAGQGPGFIFLDEICID